MRTSELGLSLIKHFEGCKLDAYLCPAKIPTIGYGNTFLPDGYRVKLGDKITKEEAEELLKVIVVGFDVKVENLIKVQIKQHEFDALVSLAYNIGVGNLSSSTLIKLVNSNAAKVSIYNEFMKWNKAGGKVLDGLTKRRRCEGTLFLTGELVFS